MIEDLGLDQVAGTKLSGLTKSELRRLSVAIYLMTDVDILFLDQPTKGMDIFDTFFLIEYLRQSSLNTGMPGPSRLHPPSPSPTSSALTRRLSFQI